MDTLEFFKALVVDLEAGQKAEDCVWAAAVERLDREAEDEDWVRYETPEALYAAFGLSPADNADR